MLKRRTDKERRCRTCDHFECVDVCEGTGYCIQPDGTRGAAVSESESCGYWQPPTAAMKAGEGKHG